MTKYIRILHAERLARLNCKFIDAKLVESLNKNLIDPKKNLIKTMSRSSTILPIFKNKIVYVYTGNRFIPFPVSSECIGHKYGEYIYTRRFQGHKKQGKKLVVKKKIIQNKLPFKRDFKTISILNLSCKKRILKKKIKYLEKDINRFIKPFKSISFFKNIII
jgi:small subunit ribosomal protein S19